MPRAKGGSIPPPRVMIEPGAGGSIVELNEHDVLCGRGGKINNHPGNVTFRHVVEQYKHEYLDPRTRKLEKAHVAARLVAQIRNTNPPGRFLKDDPSHRGAYVEIGDLKAWKKAGQACREDAPVVRKDFEEILGTDGVDYMVENDGIAPEHHPSSILEQFDRNNPAVLAGGIPPTVSYSPSSAIMPAAGPRPDPPEAPGVTGYRQPPLRYGGENGSQGGPGGCEGGQIAGRGRGPPPLHCAGHPPPQFASHPPPQGYHLPPPPPSSYFRASPPVNHGWNSGVEPPPYHPPPHFQQQQQQPPHFHHQHQHHPGQQYHPWWNGGHAWVPKPQFSPSKHLHRKNTTDIIDQSMGSVQTLAVKDFPPTESIGTQFTMSDVTALDEDQVQRLNSNFSFDDATQRMSGNNSGELLINQGAKHFSNKVSVGISGLDSITMGDLMESNLSLSLGSIGRPRSFPDLLLSTGSLMVEPMLDEMEHLEGNKTECRHELKVTNGRMIRPPYHRKSSSSSSISMASSTMRGFNSANRDRVDTGVSGVNDTLSLMSVPSRKGEGTDKSEASSWIDNFNSMQSVHSSDMDPKLIKGEDGSVRSFFSDVSSDTNALELDLVDPLLPPLTRNDSFNMGNVRPEYNRTRPDP